MEKENIFRKFDEEILKSELEKRSKLRDRLKTKLKEVNDFINCPTKLSQDQKERLRELSDKALADLKSVDVETLSEYVETEIKAINKIMKDYKEDEVPLSQDIEQVRRKVAVNEKKFGITKKTWKQIGYLGILAVILALTALLFTECIALINLISASSSTLDSSSSSTPGSSSSTPDAPEPARVFDKTAFFDATCDEQVNYYATIYYQQYLDDMKINPTLNLNVSLEDVEETIRFINGVQLKRTYATQEDILLMVEAVLHNIVNEDVTKVTNGTAGFEVDALPTSLVGYNTLLTENENGIEVLKYFEDLRIQIMCEKNSTTRATLESKYFSSFCELAYGQNGFILNGTAYSLAGDDGSLNPWVRECIARSFEQTLRMFDPNMLYHGDEAVDNTNPELEGFKVSVVAEDFLVGAPDTDIPYRIMIGETANIYALNIQSSFGQLENANYEDCIEPIAAVIGGKPMTLIFRNNF